MQCVVIANVNYTRIFYALATKILLLNAYRTDRTPTGYITGQQRIDDKVFASTISSRQAPFRIK
jgi:hypothetical protein